MNRSILCLAFLAGLCGPAWSVNKCTGPGGATVYQDTPCAGQGVKINAAPASGEANPAAMARAARSLETLQRNSAVNEAIASGRPLIGMTRSELDQAMGAPTTLNANNYNGLEKNQIVYKRPGQTYYVYTENGVVTAIQDRPDASSSATARPVNCPSDLELRNLETRASSISLDMNERQVLQERIALIRGCRGRR